MPSLNAAGQQMLLSSFAASRSSRLLFNNKLSACHLHIPLHEPHDARPVCHVRTGMQNIDVSIYKQLFAWFIVGPNNVFFVNRPVEQHGFHSRMIGWSQTFTLQTNHVGKDSAPFVQIFWWKSPQDSPRILGRLSKVLIKRERERERERERNERERETREKKDRWRGG